MSEWLTFILCLASFGVTTLAVWIARKAQADFEEAQEIWALTSRLGKVYEEADKLFEEGRASEARFLLRVTKHEAFQQYCEILAKHSRAA